MWLWQTFSPFPHLFMQFGSICTILHGRNNKNKLEHRSLQVRSLHNMNQSDFKELFIDTRTIYHEADFKAYHPSFDPKCIILSCLRTYHLHVTPYSILPDIPAPKNYRQIHKYPVSSLQHTFHDNELNKLNGNGVIKWLKKDSPHNIKALKPISLKITYLYKRSENNSIIRNVKCSISVGLMKPRISYDPDHVSTYAVDKNRLDSCQHTLVSWSSQSLSFWHILCFHSLNILPVP